MTSTASIALSGMNAARAQLNASAHNLANSQTPGFRRQEVRQSPLPGGGVTAEVGRSDVAGASPEADVVAQLQAGNAFLANLAVFRRTAALAGALLDAKA